MSRAALIFPDGFEEIEAVAVVDVLRRADIEVLMTGTDGMQQTGAHGVTLQMDQLLGDLDPEGLDAVILPGGLPGAENLAANAAVIDLLQHCSRSGILIGAICAAPIALAAAGLSEGRRLTCYPGFEERLSGAAYTGERTCVDKGIVTGKGPGAAIEFALELLRALGRAETAEQLHSGMLVR